MLSQNTIATKHRNANKKLAVVQNSYFYDPHRIEIQKIPCFKIEKIGKPSQILFESGLKDQIIGQ